MLNLTRYPFFIIPLLLVFLPIPTESIDAALLAKSDGWGVMVSHRSGETEDTTIADVCVGLSTGLIKVGGHWKAGSWSLEEPLLCSTTLEPLLWSTTLCRRRALLIDCHSSR